MSVDLKCQSQIVAQELVNLPNQKICKLNYLDTVTPPILFYFHWSSFFLLVYALTEFPVFKVFVQLNKLKVVWLILVMVFQNTCLVVRVSEIT